MECMPSWLAVIDDGTGMSAEELTEAMRFGASALWRSDIKMILDGLGLG